jgi:dTMP kinase
MRPDPSVTIQTTELPAVSLPDPHSPNPSGDNTALPVHASGGLTQSLFITLEGVDGCGKSTQARLLADALTQRGYAVYLTKNPGDTELGLALRQLLLHTTVPIQPRAELLLYLADRTQHWFQRILPSLHAGHIVICDRFIDSTLAYQGYGRGESLDWILQLHQQALHHPSRSYWPDLTLWLDAPVTVCVNRIAQRQAANTSATTTTHPIDRFEQETLAFYTRLHDGFTALARQHPDRIQPVGAEQSVESLAADILARTLAAIPAPRQS